MISSYIVVKVVIQTSTVRVHKFFLPDEGNHSVIEMLQ